MTSRLVVTGGRFHTYSLDGKRVPGVTSVVGATNAKPGLIKWAARSAAEWAAAHLEDAQALGLPSWTREAVEASDRLRDNSMTQGKQVHSIAERLVFGDAVATTDPDTQEPYPDDVVRMGEQVARFMDAWDVSADTALVERPVFNEHYSYAGTFDLCAVLRDGRRALIDYKTGATGIWPETSMQLCAYSRATHIQIGDRDMLMPPVDHCAALWVRPDAWELIPVTVDDSTFQAFIAALDVYAWQKRRKDDLIGAALPVPSDDVA